MKQKKKKKKRNNRKKQSVYRKQKVTTLHVNPLEHIHVVVSLVE